MATSCLSGDEVEQRSTSLERSNRHSLGEDNFVDLEHNLVDLEDNIVEKGSLQEKIKRVKDEYLFGALELQIPLIKTLEEIVNIRKKKLGNI